MRKIIVLSFITLDGVMQAPGAPEKINQSDSNMAAGAAPYGHEVVSKGNEKADETCRYSSGQKNI